MRSVVLFLAAVAGSHAGAQDAVNAQAIVRVFDRLCSTPLWPGYEPGQLPLAIYDGRDTWLFRHPHPPTGFAPVPGAPGTFVYNGRWPDVTANSSALIGGVATATLLPKNGDASAWAAVLVHEGFHVFQKRHPSWHGNEADLFAYPFDSAAALAGRRLEFEALRRALEAKDEAEARAWARTALEQRKARFALMPTQAGAYEEGSELNEGLANAVQFRAAGTKAQSEMPQGEYPAERLRDRFYTTGPALAQLLDRFSPGWDKRMEKEAYKSLSSALEESLAKGRGATFPSDQVERETSRAVQETQDISKAREAARAAFLHAPGWKVVVLADAAARLFPQGFDPLNVRVLSPLEVLHTRFLKLGNGAGSLELMGGEALSGGFGPHPLWNGIGTVTFTGLPDKPEWTARPDGHLAFKAKGLEGDFTGAEAQLEGQKLTIRLKAAKP